MAIDAYERTTASLLTDGLFNLGDFQVYVAYYKEVGVDWGRIGWFPYYRLYYIEEAEDAFLILKSGKVKLQSGHMYYIPMGQVVNGQAKLLKHWYIHFVPNPNDLDMLETYREIIELKVDEKVLELFRIVETCYKEFYYKKGNISSRFASSGAIRLLLSMFLKNKSDDNFEQIRFLPVLNYINANIGKAITLEDLAKAIGYNKRYFGKMFKKAFNISPLQYVMNKKVMSACQFLIGTNLSVREIAYKLGFENEFYFSRIFKNKTGKSPKAYRQTERIIGKKGI